jgi:hypothetical protein
MTFVFCTHCASGIHIQALGLFHSQRVTTFMSDNSVTQLQVNRQSIWSYFLESSALHKAIPRVLSFPVIFATVATGIRHHSHHLPTCTYMYPLCVLLA